MLKCCLSISSQTSVDWYGGKSESRTCTAKKKSFLRIQLFSVQSAVATVQQTTETHSCLQAYAFIWFSESALLKLFASFFGICFCISLYHASWSHNLQTVQSNLKLLLFFWKCLYVVVKISFWQSLFWLCSQQKDAFCRYIIAWWLEHSAEEERIQTQLANPNQTEQGTEPDSLVSEISLLPWDNNKPASTPVLSGLDQWVEPQSPPF